MLFLFVFVLIHCPNCIFIIFLYKSMYVMAAAVVKRIELAHFLMLRLQLSESQQCTIFMRWIIYQCPSWIWLSWNLASYWYGCPCLQCKYLWTILVMLTFLKYNWKMIISYFRGREQLDMELPFWTLCLANIPNHRSWAKLMKMPPKMPNELFYVF